MPAIFCNGKFYSGQKGDQGVGIDDIVQNSDNSLSIFLSTGREIRTRPVAINGTVLPAIDISTDTGKIPVIGENGEWHYDDYPSGVLPVVSEEDSGKILRVDEDGNWSVVDYTTISGLPNVTTDDEGKILKVSSEGEWEITEDDPYMDFSDVAQSSICLFIPNEAFVSSDISIAEYPVAKTIGSSAFLSCSILKTASFKDAITVENSAFYMCYQLKTVSLPKAIDLGDYAFARCSVLSSISIPVANTIGSFAFASCSYLSSIHICASSAIGNNAFAGCSRLSAIYVHTSNIPNLGTSVFENTPLVTSAYTGYFGSVFVRPSLVSVFRSAANWTFISDRITSISGYIDELPVATSADSGKVLKVNQQGEWALGADNTGSTLPTVSSSDSGKVLKVNSEGEWDIAADEKGSTLPSVSSSDSGKVLKVNSEGEWALGADNEGTGSGLPAVTTADEGKILTVDSNGNWVIVEKAPESAERIAFDLEGGYVNGNYWTVGGDTVNYSDVYIVFSGRTYMIRLDAIVGTRFRAIFTTKSVIGATANVSGGVSIVSEKDPLPYAMASYTPDSNGYIVITKDNEGTSGIITKCIVTS